MTVALRRWTDADAPVLAEARLDPYTAKIEHLDGVSLLAERVDDPWAWVVERDGEAVGGVGAKRRHVPGVAELGYWVLERARGSGIAAVAASQAVDLLFADGIERLQATVEPWNVASQRTLERAGFEREGLLRGYIGYPGEPRGDVYLYARLRGD